MLGFDPIDWMAVPGSLANDLQRRLRGVVVSPRRLSLLTPGVNATIPMLRGVWGCALHDRDRETYATVFEGLGPDGDPSDRRPLYVLRPAPADPRDAPALEWISLGGALAHDSVLLDAWMDAADRGLGPRRHPFGFRAMRHLRADGSCGGVAPAALPLAPLPWPLAGPPADTPCRLTFHVPLRLMRKGRLILCPTLGDIVAVGLRRLADLAGSAAEGEALRALQPALLETAHAVAVRPWQGESAILQRYSANQGEIEMNGVRGTLAFPFGPGALWPLLVALSWVHLGKGTVFGLGQPILEDL
ncbi:CRISPR system precrRNA processing endoribonuclease RAMP protein Cas6 [Rhodospirillum rubrum]|uniref:CRISPR-associated protein Cas6 C-terminal domain-containing protein n=1 Tax=Rhodospirillum rubrum (strain ATCC 11170 / ATH 1.1.1 / DSM 467 / LMG 4362 / NCIMB 8255 / S1) TaxID=269796 RepID=Q2RV92_RHORT|nr:CRISPR system precrRNA processing endoribonuclease RAMP protein Cas6 [Rhodospirillum rubrum]ABC21953.1 hypothetical protein Rru_A1152 [Rhodospirillum rubrum ATCC 11170]AEO47658.1 hypothetical protein F11_05940 [Rhodospirillum rubrum F11]MBK5953519.1 hypothetical protein [Rhodospirillum rubrum]QXG81606.1 CRISPR system precrRNA processing endoribonuclease RAMP protein Cas6 [Rhodospirillum rubrum]HAQ00714.1 CRISPR system precrRNA processing endoribonuclease RAMP protein Cas6 [Rhodospirillum ru